MINKTYVGIGIGAVVIQSAFMMNIALEVRQTKIVTESINLEINTIKKKVDAIEKVVLYRTTEKLTVSDKEFQCLAKNIFHEAGVENRAGKIAVAQVTLNRVKSGRWGSDICSVVYAKAQFSWTLQKKKRNQNPKGKLWDDSVTVANEFVRGGKRVQGLEASHFYHTDWMKVYPRWASKDNVSVKVGSHIFYNSAAIIKNPNSLKVKPT